MCFMIAIQTNPFMMQTSWSRNPHAKAPILEKSSKSGLIGVYHKDNLYLRTNTIGNASTQLILIREREVYGWCHKDSCSSISHFQSFREPRKGDYPTNTQQEQQRSLLIWKLRDHVITRFASSVNPRWPNRMT